MGWNRVLVLSLLLARALAPASSSAGENPRFAIPDPPTAAEQTPPMEEWLRRLAGRFEYEGVADPYSREPRAVSGRSDCIHVGDGPGVQCVLDVKWRERVVAGILLPPHPNLSPAMMVFGFEPQGARLHFLEVNSKGIAKGGTGVLNGNMAKLTTDPPRNGGVGISRIYAPAHGRFIQIWVSAKGPQGEGATNLLFYMRRVTPDETGAPLGLPSAQPDSGK